KYQLGLSQADLAAYALRLGSDCPFFIYNKPMFATGRGEIFEPLPLNLDGYHFVIIHPRLHISTAQAFSRIKPVPAPQSLAGAVMRPVAEWKNLISNDFEAAAFYFFPELRGVKEWLYDTGAVYASMTGTGSCFFGIFEPGAAPEHFDHTGLNPAWEVWTVPASKA
ncbi:MAG: 4-(cytidine 5'-diphospho)-2-C-methyl-D-erythritol kinase, partial [Sphingobacteriales bacterium]